MRLKGAIRLANPDDRSDNVEKLQQMIQDTMANLREAEDFVKAHGDEMRAEDRQDIEAKNIRREEAIEGFRAEIKDEIDQTR
ncbi:small acid-soluble spore protein (thioredoxin-like protein) [Alicyclobacillus cycloheptanicus]|uniref:Small acid-soluble spore protein (Thioredoxin-like protein) n=1 Tax=Alicyclobacillus cycloheptanicus TaxID=1457 RepID=A0ABT9XJL3_9BACL|nr:small acid-soluble spore protein (thioredoxin-like protein) [Alicyclobacillus cycloheptanicus]